MFPMSTLAHANAINDRHRLSCHAQPLEGHIPSRSSRVAFEQIDKASLSWCKSLYCSAERSSLRFMIIMNIAVWESNVN